MKKNDKMLNMDTVLKQNEKFDQIETATLSNDFDVQYYPTFKQSKLDNLVEELGKFLISKDKDSQSFIELINSDDKYSILITYFFIVKEFTHLGEQMKDAETPAQLFPYFEALVETGYLTELIEDVFSAEEIDKVIKHVAEISSINTHIDNLGNYFYNAMGEHQDKIERLQGYRNAQENTSTKKK